MYNSYMNIKLKRFLKKINYFRASRFYNRGWAELGKMISANGGFRGKRIETNAEVARFADQCVKRANWIYNVCRGKGLFKGTL